MMIQKQPVERRAAIGQAGVELGLAGIAFRKQKARRIATVGHCPRIANRPALSYSFKALAFPIDAHASSRGCDVASDITPPRRDQMNKLLATLIAGTFAVVSSAAFAQGAVTAPGAAGMEKAEKKSPKGSGAAYTNPAAEQTQAEKSAAGAAEVAKSKAQPKAQKGKFDEKAAQAVTRESTDPAQAKAAVAASKAQSPTRVKMPNIKDMTPAERAELRRELDKLSTP
jgi:hypothetical protein